MKKFTFLFFVFFLSTLASYGQEIDWNWEHASVYYFPQLVVGGGYKTDVTVTNLFNTFTNASVYFGTQTGGNLGVKAQDTRFGALKDSSQFSAALDGKSSRQVYLTSPNQNPVVGWVMVKIPKTVSGVDSAKVSLQYSYSVDDSIVGQTTVNPVKPAYGFGFYGRRFTGPNQDLSETGVAIANPNGEYPNAVSAHITVTRRNIAGQMVDSFQLGVLSPFGQISNFISELKPLPMNMYEGLVEITSDVPIVVTAFQVTFGKDGRVTFSTVATDPLP